MIKSSIYYSKVLIKNPLFVFFTLFIFIYLFYTKDILNVSVFEFDKYFYYGFIISNLFFLITASIAMNKSYKILDFFERSIIKKQLTILLASMFLSVSISVIPIAFIMWFKNNSIDSETTAMGILHFIILWILTNLLASTIGTSIGAIIKNSWSILVSLIFYSLFVWRSLSLKNMVFQKTLNIFDDNIRVVANDLLGTVFNLQYFLDKLFVLLLILILISIVGLFSNIKKRMFYVVIALVCVISVVLTASYLIKTEQHFTFQYPSLNTDSYIITSYHMDVDFSNKLKNDISLNIEVKENIDRINLLLDNIFTIKGIEIDHSPVHYSFNNNRLTIHTALKKGESVNINIAYEGTVFVNSDIGVPAFYTTKNAVNLPGNIFYWYPRKSNQEVSKFTIKTNSQSSLYSNLNEDSSNLYKGNTRYASFFAGNYKKVHKNGVEYIIPKSYHFDLFNELLNQLSMELSNEEYSIVEIEKIQNKEYKKVIVGVWPMHYKYFQLNDDTLVVGYIEF